MKKIIKIRLARINNEQIKLELKYNKEFKILIIFYIFVAFKKITYLRNLKFKKDLSINFSFFKYYSLKRRKKLKNIFYFFV